MRAVLRMNLLQSRWRIFGTSREALARRGVALVSSHYLINTGKTSLKNP